MKFHVITENFKAHYLTSPEINTKNHADFGIQG